MGKPSEWRKEPEEYIQGTPAWHAVRKLHITATDAAAIMHCSPWRSAYQLWRYKMGMIADTATNRPMRRGMAMEPVAREAFESLTGIMMFPKVVFSSEYPWAMASLDGISIDGDEILEIKCASNIVHDMAKQGKLPPYYYAQVQHQLMVTGLPRVHYYSYSGSDGAMVVVPRDEEYIEKMVIAEKKFYQHMVNKTPPPLCEDDHETVEMSKDDTAIVNRWLAILEELKVLKSEESSIRDQINTLAKGANALFCYDLKPIIKLTTFSRGGPVDWTALCKEKGITKDEIEAHRKPTHHTFKIVPYEKDIAENSDVPIM